MKDRNEIYEINESDRIAPSDFTGWSTQKSLVIATDTSIPSPPTISVAKATFSLVITIIPPTTNTDGTTIDDIKEYNIYWDTIDAIDVTDPLTYNVDAPMSVAATSKSIPTNSELYFKATCVDKWGNESVGSNEVNETPDTSSTPVIVTDLADNFANIIVGKGMIGLEFEPPVTSWTRWTGWKLYAADYATVGELTGDPITDGALIYSGAGPGFMHKNLDETHLYEYALTVLGEDGTETSGTVRDNSGAGYAPNITSNTNLLAVSIFAGHIVCDGEIRGNNFYASSYLHIGIPGWQSDGCQLEYNSGNPRFYVGDGGVLVTDKYIMFDGSNVSWRGTNTSLTTTGVFTALNAIISGSITITGGSGIASLTDAGSLATANDLDDVGDGTTYSKVLKTDISAGHILLSEATGVLGDIADGGGYSRIATTDITAGHITVVSSSASININSAVWQNQGIQLQYNAGTPRAYMGDGGVTSGDRYFMFDGANISFRGVNTSLTAAGLFSCSNIVITGAGSTWGGAKIAQANIANLTTAIITSGTFDAVRIPNLSTDKLTTGTLLVGRTQAKCTDASADNTAAHETYGSAAEVRAGTGWSHASNTTLIDGGDIYTNTVRTAQIYIDGDLYMSPGGGYNSIKGLDLLATSPTGATTMPFISMTPGTIQVHSGTTAGNDLWLTGRDWVNVDAGGDITLDAGDDIILDAAGEIDFIGADQGTISYLDGPDQTIRVKHNGVVKLLGLWDL